VAPVQHGCGTRGDGELGRLRCVQRSISISHTRTRGGSAMTRFLEWLDRLGAIQPYSALLIFHQF
jgi:hypothetical protein